MAEQVNKKLDKIGLSHVWAKIGENFVSKGILTDELIDKLYLAITQISLISSIVISSSSDFIIKSEKSYVPAIASQPLTAWDIYDVIG